jgi:hypothetical protein
LPRWLPAGKGTHRSNWVAKHLARKRLFGTAKRLEAACTGLSYARHLAALVAGSEKGRAGRTGSPSVSRMSESLGTAKRLEAACTGLLYTRQLAALVAGSPRAAMHFPAHQRASNLRLRRSAAAAPASFLTERNFPDSGAHFRLFSTILRTSVEFRQILGRMRKVLYGTPQ